MAVKKPDEASSDIRSMLNSVIGAGKSVLKAMDLASVKAFIESQPEVIGPVSIDELQQSGDVGASSGIVIFAASLDRGDGPESAKFVLRHAPISESRLYFEYDMARQFRVQRALQGSGVPVPEPLWLDADGRYLGVPGFIMAYRPGRAPNPSAFASGPLAEADTDERSRMIDEVMSALVKIHSVDISALGLEDFALNAPGDSAVARCVNWYWKTWEWIRQPEYERLVPVHQWLLDNVPAGDPELVHGDATLHNYMFHEKRLVGIVDWEMSCLCRAEADLALQCITNRLFAAPEGSGTPRPPSEQEWLERYYKAGGRQLRDFDYFKKLAAYLTVVAATSLQRNMPEQQRAREGGLLHGFWRTLEA